MGEGFVVAVASGKGGTGKTTVATNLAKLYAGRGQPVQYLDCDVEEPNGHIFLKPTITGRQDVTVEVPEVDLEKCTACGQCGQICQYSAIVALGDQVLTFEPLCHSCAGCWLVCPSGAIQPKPLKIGELETGHVGELGFVSGRLEIGHVRTPSMIHHVKGWIDPEALAIVDVPPGTSCPVVAALRDVDFVLLVTEPTPFGLNDLELAVETVRLLRSTLEEATWGDDALRVFGVTDLGRIVVEPGLHARLPRRTVESVARWCVAFAAACLDAKEEDVLEPIREATRQRQLDLERVGFYGKLYRAAS